MLGKDAPAKPAPYNNGTPIRKEHVMSKAYVTPGANAGVARAVTTVIVVFFAMMILACSGVETPNSTSTGRKWYEGGTLHRAKISEWRSASYENRLAACSDFVMTMRGNGVVPADLPVDEYKPYAVDLERGISKVASGGNADNETVAGVAAMIRVLEEKDH
jgi:hypothetical protein